MVTFPRVSRVRRGVAGETRSASSPEEERLDRLAALAARACGVPYVRLCLTHGERTFRGGHGESEPGFAGPRLPLTGTGGVAGELSVSAAHPRPWTPDDVA